MLFQIEKPEKLVIKFVWPYEVNYYLGQTNLITSFSGFSIWKSMRGAGVFLLLILINTSDLWNLNHSPFSHHLGSIRVLTKNFRWHQHCRIVDTCTRAPWPIDGSQSIAKTVDGTINAVWHAVVVKFSCEGVGVYTITVNLI